MPRVDAVVNCPLYDSFRVQQVAGMFDVPVETACQEHFSVELPDLCEPWRIGLIVGPSGSGKTTIARQAFGLSPEVNSPWPSDAAVIDGFGDLPVREVIAMLTAVGLSSPRAWIRPYGVLSGGERFRCDLARALLGDASPVVVDEFTSMVDRTVAKIGSAAVSGAIRRGRVDRRLVAVTCHYDVAPWLAPDWTLDMASGRLARSCLRRPDIRLRIFRCEPAAWRLFARHHYLSSSLNPAARCYLALWEETPVAFVAALRLIGRRRRWRLTRIVVLPDYQGIGIGARVVAAVSDLLASGGERVNVTSGHPGLIAHCRRSPRWRCVAVQRAGPARRNSIAAREGHESWKPAIGRAVVSFEYVPEARRPALPAACSTPPQEPSDD